MNCNTLRQFSIFTLLEDEALSQILEITTEQTLQDNDVIFNEGDPGDALYLIVSGKIRITKIIDRETGTSKDLAILPDGVFFGEMSLFKDETRSATAAAIGATKLLCITKEDFNQLLTRNAFISSQILMAIIDTLNKRLRETNLQLVTVYDSGKIIGKLLPLEETAGQLLNRLLSTIQAEQSLLALKNESMETLELIAHCPFNTDLAGLGPLSLTDGIIGWVLSTKEPIMVSDFNNQPEITETLTCEGYENHAMLAVPVISEDRALGVILLTHSTPGFFTYSHLTLAAGVADQTGAAIVNAKFRQEEQAKQRASRQYISF